MIQSLKKCFVDQPIDLTQLNSHVLVLKKMLKRNLLTNYSQDTFEEEELLLEELYKSQQNKLCFFYFITKMNPN